MIRAAYCALCLFFFAMLSKTNADNPLFFTRLDLLCDKTLHAKSCYNNLSPLIDSTKNYTLHFLYNLSVQVSKNAVSKSYKKLYGKEALAQMLLQDSDGFGLSHRAKKICRDLFSLAVDDLNSSISSSVDDPRTNMGRANLKKRLALARARLQACIDNGFPSDEARKFGTKWVIGKTMESISTSLSILSRFDEHTRDLEEGSSPHSVKSARMKPNVVVAADGSGDHKTISEAIKDVPKMSSQRFVIYVKKGLYNENVIIAKEQWNVIMYGDGMTASVVSSNLSSSSGLLPVKTATFAVYGKGFVAMDLGFENTAGPAGGQALALLTASDQSVFYRCRIDGYQDTLRTDANRQFYRECDILGAIDFIYGDATAVIQNSNILVKRRPSLSVITAQGKDNPQTNTGLSIQNCTIAPAKDLLKGIKTFLGRPWKDRSTTVIMESHLGSFIDPRGWVSLQKGVDPPDTILYIEYNNRGPGAGTAGRVRWKGLKVKNTKEDARKFTVREFINGDQWIPATGVPFHADLLE